MRVDYFNGLGADYFEASLVVASIFYTPVGFIASFKKKLIIYLFFDQKLLSGMMCLCL